MDDIRAILFLLAWLLLVALLTRFVLSMIAAYARSWTPRGAMLLLASGVYAVTDLVVRPLRKVIPPLTLGGMRLDLTLMVAVTAVYLAVYLLR